MPAGRLLEATSDGRPRGMIAIAKGATRSRNRTRLTPVTDHVPASQEVGTCFLFVADVCGTKVAEWDSMDPRRVALLIFATIVACREDDTVQTATLSSATLRTPDVAFADYRGTLAQAQSQSANFGLIGTSLAPKSTVLAWICATPPPDPIAW